MIGVCPPPPPRWIIRYRPLVALTIALSLSLSLLFGGMIDPSNYSMMNELSFRHEKGFFSSIGFGLGMKIWHNSKVPFSDFFESLRKKRRKDGQESCFSMPKSPYLLSPS